MQGVSLKIRLFCSSNKLPRSLVLSIYRFFFGISSLNTITLTSKILHAQALYRHMCRVSRPRSTWFRRNVISIISRKSSPTRCLLSRRIRIRATALHEIRRFVWKLTTIPRDCWSNSRMARSIAEASHVEFIIEWLRKVKEGQLQGLALFENASRCIECVPSVCTALHMHYVTDRQRFLTVSPDNPRIYDRIGCRLWLDRGWHLLFLSPSFVGHNIRLFIKYGRSSHLSAHGGDIYFSHVLKWKINISTIIYTELYIQTIIYTEILFP